MEDIVIEELKIGNTREIEEVTEMLYNWWGEEEGYTKEVIKTFVESMCVNKEIPITYVAKIKTEVGTRSTTISHGIGDATGAQVRKSGSKSITCHIPE